MTCDAQQHKKTCDWLLSSSRRSNGKLSFEQAVVLTVAVMVLYLVAVCVHNLLKYSTILAGFWLSP